MGHWFYLHWHHFFDINPNEGDIHNAFQGPLPINTNLEGLASEKLHKSENIPFDGEGDENISEFSYTEIEDPEWDSNRNEGFFDELAYLNATASIKKRTFRNNMIPAGTLHRSEPDWGLRAVSRPPGQLDTDEYYYERTEARSNHTFVYVLDRGFFIKHREFRHNPITEFLPRETNYTPPLHGPTAHGTAVLSKIIGWTTGTARYANVIAVTVQKGITGEFYIVEWEAALQRILNDIEARTAKSRERGEKIHPKFIVNLTFGYVPISSDDWPPEKDDTYLNLYRSLNATMFRFGERKDTLLVVANPNGESEPRWRWPHNILYEMRYRFPNAVVVSGVDEKGVNTVPMLRLPATFAPAVRMRTALVHLIKDKDKPDIIGLKDAGVGMLSGNSLAAPMISGILANFLADGRLSVQEVKKRLGDFAYARGPNQHPSANPAVVWNGQMSPAKNPGAPFPIKIFYVCNDAAPKDKFPEVRTLSSVEIPVPEQTPAVSVTGIVSVTITRCGQSIWASEPPTQTLAKSLGPTPTVVGKSENRANYEGNLCELCKKAAGEAPIDGVVYIPKDCPCK
ncbi:hypothetical protein TWF718_002156 [Orbilia javanica]|uniref:Peptidase S8/S53 domain-containing protein n=1 Tax=Orbilia javanica TaxID=47235 RepID=A0AAN8R9M9_9PEZI